MDEEEQGQRWYEYYWHATENLLMPDADAEEWASEQMEALLS